MNLKEEMKQQRGDIHKMKEEINQYVQLILNQMKQEKEKGKGKGIPIT